MRLGWADSQGDPRPDEPWLERLGVGLRSLEAWRASVSSPRTGVDGANDVERGELLRMLLPQALRRRESMLRIPGPQVGPDQGLVGLEACRRQINRGLESLESLLALVPQQEAAAEPRRRSGRVGMLRDHLLELFDRVDRVAPGNGDAAHRVARVRVVRITMRHGREHGLDPFQVSALQAHRRQQLGGLGEAGVRPQNPTKIVFRALEVVELPVDHPW